MKDIKIALQIDFVISADSDIVSLVNDVYKFMLGICPFIAYSSFMIEDDKDAK